MPYELERQIAIEAVARASRLCQEVQRELVADSALSKDDKSPVTVADFGAQAVVKKVLSGLRAGAQDQRLVLDPLVSGDGHRCQRQRPGEPLPRQAPPCGRGHHREGEQEQEADVGVDVGAAGLALEVRVAGRHEDAAAGLLQAPRGVGLGIEGVPLG